VPALVEALKDEGFAGSHRARSRRSARPPSQRLPRLLKIRTQMCADLQLPRSGGSAQPPLMPIFAGS
jgi:hypothetical protein